MHSVGCDGLDDDERLISRPATAADIRAFYGDRPHPTLKALVVTRADEVLGVIGLAREGRRAKYFSEIKEDLRPRLKRMISLRTIWKSMDLVRNSRLPVYALAQADEPDSHRVLQRLGFVQIESEVYQWPS